MMIFKMRESYYMMDDINDVLTKFYKRPSCYAFHPQFGYVCGFSMEIIDIFNTKTYIPLSRKIITAPSSSVEYRFKEQDAYKTIGSQLL